MVQAIHLFIGIKIPFRGEKYTRIAYFVTLVSGELEKASVLISMAGPAEDDIQRLLKCETSAMGTPYHLDVDVRPHPDTVSYLTGEDDT